MSSKDVLTAYNVAVPEKQEQNLPGLDKNMKRAFSEYAQSSFSIKKL